MSHLPLISVVIANYNYARYLKECVESALTQTYPAVELIVVDDGSTDDSHSVLQRYGERITVVRQENKGVAAARNVGISRSKGEWVAFLDSDDSWSREKLQEQSKCFGDPSVGMVFCGLQHIDDSGACLGYTRPVLAGDLLPKLVTFTTSSIGGGSSVVARAEVLRALGGFDKRLTIAADLDMWIRISAQQRVMAITSPLVKCRRHAGSMGSNVGRFESENDLVLIKAFANPECSRVFHLRRRSFGKLYMIIAGSYFHHGDARKAARYVMKSLLHRPSQISYVLGLPVRALRRSGLIPASRVLAND
jgi:glycosyltransferase involved in cell wall biosynthesis